MPQEFVGQQVAEKERAKLEEKLHREREDALEEARLARERDKMKADFEREGESKEKRGELQKCGYLSLERLFYSTYHKATNLCVRFTLCKLCESSAGHV